MHPDVTAISKKYKKEFRKLIRLWTQMTKTENFIIPETIEDIKQIGIFSPKIKLKRTECYFNEKSKVLLSEFIDTLCGIHDLNQVLSYSSISSKTIKYIEKSITDEIDRLPQLPTSEIINSLINDLISEIGKYEVFRLINGIELKGLKSLIFGNVEIFTFNKKHYGRFLKYRTCNDQNDFYDENVVPFLNKNFFGKICASTVLYGDRETAEKNAQRKFGQIINMLRGFVCLLEYKRISENLAKINLLGESYDTIERGVEINHTEKNFILHSGRSRKSLYNLPIDNDLILDLKKYYFLDDLCSLFSDESKTEIEKAILTAMHWIGEAQDEYDFDSAFIKYWTALETLFSQEGETTESIARGVSIQLGYGGYGFIELDEIKNCYIEVKKLYNKRSRIIHGGKFESVSSRELSSVCKYSIFSFFSFLGIRSIGYSKLEQVNFQINRLFYLDRYKYLTSKKSKVYHKLTCPSIKRTHQHNIIGIVNEKDAIKSKKKPCRLCLK